MPQPSDVRLVTEARHTTDLQATLGRLAAVEQAAGFDGPPLGFEDEIVASLFSSTDSATLAMAMSRFSPVGGGRPVGKGELAINVADFGAIGGDVNESAQWRAAVLACVAQGGGVVTAQKGKTYTVEGIPLHSKVWFDLRGVTLKLPTTPQKHMFVAETATNIGSAGIQGGEYIGVNKTRNWVDFSAVAELEHFTMDSVFVHDFDRGYNGSKNDRFPVLVNSRIRLNNVGAYITSNHPIFHFTDFRFNDVALTGRINDLYAIGCKFNWGRVGMQPAAGENIRNSQFVGCVFGRNTEKGAVVSSRNTFTGCFFFGKDNNDDGLTLLDHANIVTSNYFGYETVDGTWGGAAIRFASPGNFQDNTLISGNLFQVNGSTAVGIAAKTNPATLRNTIISGNSVRLGAGRKWIDLPTFPNSQLIGNSILVTGAGLPAGSALVEIGWMGDGGSDFSHNTFAVVEGTLAGAALKVGNVLRSTFIANRFRSFAGKPIITTSSESMHNARWRANEGFKTADTGNTGVAPGTTSTVVEHGLDIPITDGRWIQLTPLSSLGSATQYWVGDVTGTSFTINLNQSAGGNWCRFSWSVDIGR